MPDCENIAFFLHEHDLFSLQILNRFVRNSQQLSLRGGILDDPAYIHVGLQVAFAVVDLHPDLEGSELFIDEITDVGDLAVKMAITVKIGIDVDNALLVDLRDILFIGIQDDPKGCEIGNCKQDFFRFDMLPQDHVPINNGSGKRRKD